MRTVVVVAGAVLLLSACSPDNPTGTPRTSRSEFQELQKRIDDTAVTALQTASRALDGSVVSAVGSMAGCGLPGLGQSRYSVDGQLKSTGRAGTRSSDRLMTALKAAGIEVTPQGEGGRTTKNGFEVVVLEPTETPGKPAYRYVSVVGECLTVGKKVADQLEGRPDRDFLADGGLG